MRTSRAGFVLTLALLGLGSTTCSPFPVPVDPNRLTTDERAPAEVAAAGRVGQAVEDAIRAAAPGLASTVLDAATALAKQTGHLAAPVTPSVGEDGRVRRDAEGNPLWEWGQAGGLLGALGMLGWVLVRGKQIVRAVEDVRQNKTG